MWEGMSNSTQLSGSSIRVVHSEKVATHTWRIIPLTSNPHLKAIRRPFGKGPFPQPDPLGTKRITMVMNHLRVIG